MDRHVTTALAHFCIAQRAAFDSRAWYARFATDGAALALAAKYLSMTSWYGHEDALEHIVARTHPFDDGSAGLYRESQAIHFDLPYFSATVRLGLAQLRPLPPPPPQPERRCQPVFVAKLPPAAFAGACPLAVE